MSVASGLSETAKQSNAYNILARTESPDAPAPQPTTTYVGMYRPYHSRGGALSELEYFEYTGFKLGEDYQQTKQEALQALGLKEGDIKLTKEEEEKFVQAYIDLRYQAFTGLYSQDESKSLIPGKESPEALKRDITITAEKGLLRKEFEEKGLAISEQTLREYELLKHDKPDLTFQEYAYHKTIGSKSELEKVGLGLFSQQALGFYELGKYVGLPRQEYLDLMQIGLSYKPIIEHSMVHSFLPFQRDDLGFNIGVGLGLAIDIITFKSFAKSITSYIKAPSEIVGLVSRANFKFELGKVTAQYRTLGFTAEKMKVREFVGEILKPTNITQAFKDVFKVGKGIEDNIPVGMKTEMITAGLKREYPVISTMEGKATREIKRLESPKVGVEGDILFKKETELKEDPWLKQERALSHLQKVQETGTLEEALRTYGVEDIKLAQRVKPEIGVGKPMQPEIKPEPVKPEIGSEVKITLSDISKGRQSSKLETPQIPKVTEAVTISVTRTPAGLKPIQPFKSLVNITTNVKLQLGMMKAIQPRTQLVSVTSLQRGEHARESAREPTRLKPSIEEPSLEVEEPIRPLTPITTNVEPTLTVSTAYITLEPQVLRTKSKPELLSKQQIPRLSYSDFKLPKVRTFSWYFPSDKAKQKAKKGRRGGVEIFGYPMPSFIQV